MRVARNSSPICGRCRVLSHIEAKFSKVESSANSNDQLRMYKHAAGRLVILVVRAQKIVRPVASGSREVVSFGFIGAGDDGDDGARASE